SRPPPPGMATTTARMIRTAFSIRSIWIERIETEGTPLADRAGGSYSCPVLVRAVGGADAPRRSSASGGRAPYPTLRGAPRGLPRKPDEKTPGQPPRGPQVANETRQKGRNPITPLQAASVRVST